MREEGKEMSDKLKPCLCCDGYNLIEDNYSLFVICNDCSAFDLGNADLTHDEAVKKENAYATLNTERTCKFISSKGSDYPPVCNACGYELSIYDCEWFEDGTYGYDKNYCPNCGAKVMK